MWGEKYSATCFTFVLVVMWGEKYSATCFVFVFCKLINIESSLNAKCRKIGFVYVCVSVCVIAVQLIVYSNMFASDWVTVMVPCLQENREVCCAGAVTCI
jgi:hypothetical protein